MPAADISKPSGPIVFMRPKAADLNNEVSGVHDYTQDDVKELAGNIARGESKNRCADLDVLFTLSLGIKSEKAEIRERARAALWALSMLHAHPDRLGMSPSHGQARIELRRDIEKSSALMCKLLLDPPSGKEGTKEPDLPELPTTLAKLGRHCKEMMLRDPELLKLVTAYEEQSRKAIEDGLDEDDLCKQGVKFLFGGALAAQPPLEELRKHFPWMAQWSDTYIQQKDAGASDEDLQAAWLALTAKVIIQVESQVADKKPVDKKEKPQPEPEKQSIAERVGDLANAVMDEAEASKRKDALNLLFVMASKEGQSEAAAALQEIYAKAISRANPDVELENFMLVSAHEYCQAAEADDIHPVVRAYANQYQLRVLLDGVKRAQNDDELKDAVANVVKEINSASKNSLAAGRWLLKAMQNGVDGAGRDEAFLKVVRSEAYKACAELYELDKSPSTQIARFALQFALKSPDQCSPDVVKKLQAQLAIVVADPVDRPVDGEVVNASKAKDGIDGLVHGIQASDGIGRMQLIERLVTAAAQPTPEGAQSLAALIDLYDRPEGHAPEEDGNLRQALGQSLHAYCQTWHDARDGGKPPLPVGMAYLAGRLGYGKQASGELNERLDEYVRAQLAASNVHLEEAALFQNGRPTEANELLAGVNGLAGLDSHGTVALNGNVRQEDVTKSLQSLRENLDKEGASRCQVAWLNSGEPGFKHWVPLMVVRGNDGKAHAHILDTRGVETDHSQKLKADIERCLQAAGFDEAHIHMVRTDMQSRAGAAEACGVLGTMLLEKVNDQMPAGSASSKADSDLISATVKGFVEGWTGMRDEDTEAAVIATRAKQLQAASVIEMHKDGHLDAAGKAADGWRADESKDPKTWVDGQVRSLKGSRSGDQSQVNCIRSLVDAALAPGDYGKFAVEALKNLDKGDPVGADQQTRSVMRTVIGRVAFAACSERLRQPAPQAAPVPHFMAILAVRYAVGMEGAVAPETLAKLLALAAEPNDAALKAKSVSADEMIWV